MAEATKDKTKKTQVQRAEDVAYTLNHAIACSVTDLGVPVISHGIAKKFFHSHSNLWEWFAGEGIGDVAAVPVTIAVERYAPRLTSGIRKGMESTLGWAFRKSSQREAQAWARNNDVAQDSAETKNRAQRIYNYEIDHLPQAAIWTVTSMALNIATQKMFHHHLHAGHSHGHSHGHSVAEIAGALIVGKGVSTGLVIGARAAFPDKAHRWDNFAARKLFAPIESAARKLAGAPARDISWEQQVKRGDDAVPAMSK